MSPEGPSAPVRLGRQPKREDTRTLKLARYIAPEALPTGHLDLARNVPEWGMLGNDQVGNCGPVAFQHLRIGRSAEAAGHPLTVGLDETLALYRRVSGWNGRAGDPSDAGVVLLDMLNSLRHDGQLYAFAEVDRGDLQEMRAAHYLFGGVLLGYALPAYLEQRVAADVAAPWVRRGRGALTGSAEPGSWGGHAVCSVRDDRWRVCTWGQVVRMSAAFHFAYCDEAYALITPEWFSSDRSPAGFDLDALRADLGRL